MGFSTLLKATINDFLRMLRLSDLSSENVVQRKLSRYRFLINTFMVALVFSAIAFYSMQSSYDESEVVVNILPLSKDNTTNATAPLAYFCVFKLFRTDLEYLMNFTLTNNEKELSIFLPDSHTQKRVCSIMRYDSSFYLESRGTLIVVSYSSNIKFTTSQVEGGRRLLNLSSDDPLRFVVKNPKATMVQNSSTSFSLVNTILEVNREYNLQLNGEEKSLDYVVSIERKTPHNLEFGFTLKNTKVELLSIPQLRSRDITQSATVTEQKKSLTQVRFGLKENVTQRTFWKISGDFISRDPLLSSIDGKHMIKYEMTDRSQSSWIAKAFKLIALLVLILSIFFIVLFISNVISFSLVSKTKLD